MSNTLHELLSHIEWSEAAFALRRYFREGARDLKPFRLAFDRLRQTVPASTSYQLVFQRRESNPDDPWERDEPAEVGCANSAGHGLPRGENFWSLEFRSWEECLGMKVPMAARIAYMDAGVVAHCMWEMTRHGQEKCDPLDLLVKLGLRHPGAQEDKQAMRSKSHLDSDPGMTKEPGLFGPFAGGHTPDREENDG